jgi:hypothetical protein
MRGCRRRQKHQRSEPSIHFLIYGFASRVKTMDGCWQTKPGTREKQSKTSLQLLATVFQSRPRRRFGAS